MQLAIPNFPRVALLLGTTGLLAGLAVSFAVTPRYDSSAVLQVVYNSAPQPATLVPAALQLRLQNEVLSRTTLSAIIQDPRLDLYPRERAQAPLEDVIEHMRHDLQMRIMGRPEFPTDRYVAFEISFSYSDPHKAQQTVQALLNRFMDLNVMMKREKFAANPHTSGIDELKSRITVLEKRLGIGPSAPVSAYIPNGSGNLDDPILEVLDPPSLPVHALYPNRIVFMATGFGIGIGMALILMIFRQRPQSIQPVPASMA